jgi:hypothetical protein
VQSKIVSENPALKNAVDVVVEFLPDEVIRALKLRAA